MKKSGDPGLYAAIHAKRARIAAGSGAPTAKAFRESAKTAKRKPRR